MGSGGTAAEDRRGRTSGTVHRYTERYTLHPAATCCRTSWEPRPFCGRRTPFATPWRMTPTPTIRAAASYPANTATRHLRPCRATFPYLSAPRLPTITRHYQRSTSNSEPPLAPTLRKAAMAARAVSCSEHACALHAPCAPPTPQHAARLPATSFCVPAATHFCVANAGQTRQPLAGGAISPSPTTYRAVLAPPHSPRRRHCCLLRATCLPAYMLAPCLRPHAPACPAAPHSWAWLRWRRLAGAGVGQLWAWGHGGWLPGQTLSPIPMDLSGLLPSFLLLHVEHCPVLPASFNRQKKARAGPAAHAWLPGTPAPFNPHAFFSGQQQGAWEPFTFFHPMPTDT